MTELINTGPRGFNWDRLKVPQEAHTTNPSSPRQKEALRPSIVQKEGMLQAHSADKLSVMASKEAMAATMGRTAPADMKTKLLVDPRVQDLSAEAGFKRSTQTNIIDFGPHINTNKLRFERQQGFMNSMPLDGGSSYSPNACTGNWVEERREPGYASGFHARELGFTKLYSTEHSDRYKPTAKYYKKVMAENPTAKMPVPSLAMKATNGNSSDGHHLYYSTRGFGDKVHMDHTKPSSRGGYWVGTAPTKRFETIACTCANQGRLEFQKRNSAFDPKAKIMGGATGLDMANPYIQCTMQGLAQSQRHTSTWKTSYRNGSDRIGAAYGYKVINPSVSADGYQRCSWLPAMLMQYGLCWTEQASTYILERDNR